jgi:hypothetical protein
MMKIEMMASSTNICECCWELGKTYKHEHGYVCAVCIEILKKLKNKEVDKIW